MSDDPLSDADRSGAMLAHLSGYAGYVVPCGGVLVPLLIAVTAQSRAVAAVARQALALNVLGFFSVLLGVGGYALLAVVEHPVARVLLVCVLTVWILFVFLLIVGCPLVGAIRASQGRYFRYPIFGVSMPD